MSNIFDLDKKRKQKLDAINKKSPAEYEQERKHRFKLVADGLIADWEYNASTDNLLSFIAKSLFQDETDLDYLDDLTDYLNDLNVVSKIEQDMGIPVVMFYPKTLPANQHGWVAGFHINDATYSTPEMVTECYARIFNVLLYLRVLEDGKC